MGNWVGTIVAPSWRHFWLPVLLVALVAIPSNSAGKIKPWFTILQGNVRFEGKPVKRAWIEILGPPHTDNLSWVAPVITPKVVGVISSTEPTIVTSSYGFIPGGKGHFRRKLNLADFNLRPGAKFYLKVGTKLWVTSKPTPEKFQQVMNAPHACVPISLDNGAATTPLEIELTLESHNMQPCW